MPESTDTLYEGLFLLDQQAVATDFSGAIDELKNILNRSSVDLVTLVKWDERKLAYDIKGQRRGTFLLALFRCPGSAITKIDRDCTLSDTILRNLIIRGDAYGQTEIDLLKQDADALVAEAKMRAEQGSDDAPATGSTSSNAPAEPDSDSPSDDAPAEEEKAVAAESDS